MKVFQTLKQQLQFFPKAHLIVFTGLLMLLGLSQCMQNEQSTRKLVKLELNKKSIRLDNAATTEAISDSWIWHKEEVRSGDSVSAIFKRQKISSTVLHHVMSGAKDAERLLKIFPGQTIHFAFDNNEQLQEIKYASSQLETIIISRGDGDIFSSEIQVRNPEIRLVYKKAIIKDILSLAGEDAGIPFKITMKVANILSGVVDFVFDVRSGHSFDVLYEEQYLDGKRIAIGNVLAAAYNNEEDSFTAYRYEFADERVNYYSPEGVSMRKPFLRTPLDSFRVSSGFNLKRRHPIHKKIRAHRGIDYAAPRGTPIFTVADGRVKRSGFSKANGNYIFISHPGGFETKYLHLQKRYVKTGQKVKQGSTIGTLGSTGYSTGPHLHYEFLVNGVHRNPKTIYRKLPSAKPVPESDQARFQEQIKYIKLQYKNLQLGYKESNA